MPPGICEGMDVESFMPGIAIPVSCPGIICTGLPGSGGNMPPGICEGMDAESFMPGIALPVSIPGIICTGLPDFGAGMAPGFSICMGAASWDIEDDIFSSGLAIFIPS